MAAGEGNSEKTQGGSLDAMLSPMRDFVARYIDATADFAKQLVEFQALSTSWAKETPMASFFESQNSLTLDLIHFWASAARSMWRIETPAPKSTDGGL